MTRSTRELISASRGRPGLRGPAVPGDGVIGSGYGAGDRWSGRGAVALGWRRRSRPGRVTVDAVATWVWREALDDLGRVMPGSAGFQLDQIEGIAAGAWRRFPLDDEDVPSGERLVAEVGTTLGTDLVVVTDASWRPDVGPFVLPSWHLSGLVRDHLAITGEPFFGGDLVILSPDEGTLVALLRAGLMAVAQGTPSPRPELRPLAHLTDCAVFAAWPAELEWRHLYGELYPETAVTLPSGRTIRVRWFETDTRVSFTAPTGDFQISFRGPAEEADDACQEFLAVAGLSGSDVLRMTATP